MPNPEPVRPDPAAGGRARAAKLTAERRTEIARKAAAAATSPAAAARRLAKMWPNLNRAERAEVREVLRQAGVTL